MMIECVKHLGGLRPVDDAGTQLLTAFKHGEHVLVEVKRPRNLKHHRKMFALLNVVQPNTSYPNVYALLSALKVYLGHCDVQQTKGGKTVAVPRSISFHAMGQDEFNAFYEGCVQAVITHFIPGLAESDLRREVEDLCQVRAA